MPGSTTNPGCPFYRKVIIYIICPNKGKNRPSVYIGTSRARIRIKKSAATVRSMPIARNRCAARKAKAEGNLGVGGASTRVAWPGTARKERQREVTARRGRGRGQGKKKGDVRIAVKGWGSWASRGGKTHAGRWRGQEVQEGGSRSPRGRTHTQHTRILRTHIRYTYGAAQHGRVHGRVGSARARCSVDRVCDA